jgi:L-alanine-DL-glutamate epimerase-like enolase superfamily enzyme
MSSWDALAQLPLGVDGYELRRIDSATVSGWVRSTTVICLRGGGQEGLGEDVTYETEDHDAPNAAGATLPLAGDWTLESFSAQLASLDLFPAPPHAEVYRHYRAWAFESAALDLALRQAGLTLHAALDRRRPQPVTFVASVRLPEPPTLELIDLRLARHADLRFKLDPTPSWDAALIGELAARGIVATADLKGFYSGTTVDNPPDPVLYGLIAELLPDAWIEDPALTPQTDAVLAPHRDRITWDAPIHSVADVLALPFAPRMLNVKPSRFGTLRALLDFYDHCAEHAIGNYGGGQTELGVGRGQIQYLASLFHPDSPNDVAPAVYNLEPLPAEVPGTPLAPAPSATGFRWGEEPPASAAAGG